MKISNPIKKKPYSKSYITDPLHPDFISLEIVNFGSLPINYETGFLYNSSYKEGSIKRIKKGKGDKVIFIDGFLSEGVKKHKEWKGNLNKIYPDNSWYAFEWSSKNTKSFFTRHKTISFERKEMIKIRNMYIYESTWKAALINAKKAGEFLAKELSTKKNDTFILCGHSLGARVIYSTLKELQSIDNNKIIRDVHLMGGAIGNSADDWKKAKRSIFGSIYNYKSKNDMVLKYLYKFGTFLSNKPIGRYNIAVNGVINVDVSHFVNGHTKYKKNFSRFVVSCNRSVP